MVHITALRQAVERAIDTMLLLASPSAYKTLVHSRDYSTDEFERSVGATLIAALLPEPPAWREDLNPNLLETS